jgi:AraC family transcriptional regulator, transcriptional activator of pobA
MGRRLEHFKEFGKLMQNQYPQILINKLDGNMAFKIFNFSDGIDFDHLQRNNFYSIIWIKKGQGKLKVDFSEYEFTENALFTFSPYQPFKFSVDNEITGVSVQFHSDFFCIHANHSEVGCDGVLFNNIYEKPFFNIKSASTNLLDLLLDQMKTEVKMAALAQYEQIVSYLKIFLITASRIKTEEISDTNFKTIERKEPEILKKLKVAIEENFRAKHSASDYAGILNISANALAKTVKTNYNKTLTCIITERIIIEAKRELYLSSKPIKEIAWALGYSDEYYFSRMFKANTEISPQGYRDTVGFAKVEMM